MRFLSIGKQNNFERVKLGFIMIRWGDADYGGKNITLGITSPFWSEGEVPQYHTFENYQGKYRKAWFVQLRVRFLGSKLTPKDFDHLD